MRADNVDVRFKKPLTGKYNKAISCCLNCDHEFMMNKTHGSLFDNINGFADTHIGLVAMWECPTCFSKWFYHGIEHYDYFLDSVENGKNKFFSTIK